MVRHVLMGSEAISEIILKMQKEYSKSKTFYWELEKFEINLK